MASQLQSDAARRNGSKSRGPITPEGKARSSQNARKHGLCASFDALPGESQPALDALLASFDDSYHPATPLECDLVRTLALLRWRLRRIPALESAIFTNELALAQEQIDAEFSEIDDAGRLGFVFRQLADGSRALPLLIRYEASLNRLYTRTLKHLAEVQKLRNEPTALPFPPSPRPSPHPHRDHPRDGAKIVGMPQTIYEAAGGKQAFLNLAHAWHVRCLADPVVSHAFSHGYHPQHSERLAAYWAEALGGPVEFTGSMGDESSVVRMHSGNGQHQEMDERAETCFAQALDDAAFPEDPRLRETLKAYFHWAVGNMDAYPKSAKDVPSGLPMARWSWDGPV